MNARQKQSAEYAALAAAMYEELGSYKAVGREMDISRSRVGQLVKAHERNKKREEEEWSYLSTRTLNALSIELSGGKTDTNLMLKNYHLITREAISKYTEAQLLRLPNFGLVCLSEVKEWLALGGMCLTDGKQSAVSRYRETVLNWNAPWMQTEVDRLDQLDERYEGRHWSEVTMADVSETIRCLRRLLIGYNKLLEKETGAVFPLPKKAQAARGRANG